jgi:hypothetical protein
MLGAIVPAQALPSDSPLVTSGCERAEQLANTADMARQRLIRIGIQNFRKMADAGRVEIDASGNLYVACRPPHRASQLPAASTGRRLPLVSGANGFSLAQASPTRGSRRILRRRLSSRRSSFTKAGERR